MFLKLSSFRTLREHVLTNDVKALSKCLKVFFQLFLFQLWQFKHI